MIFPRPAIATPATEGVCPAIYYVMPSRPYRYMGDIWKRVVPRDWNFR